MSIIKALIGMSHWKKRMKKLQSQTPYTEEWWAEVIDSAEFLPKEQRRGFVNKFISTLINF